jgi:uncharacterized protein HemX
MTTEQQPEPVIPSEEATKRDEAEEQPTSRRVAYKSVLSAVVVGIIAIGGLSFFIVQQQANPIDDVQVSESGTPMQGVIKRPESEMAIVEDKIEQIDQRLTSLSGRIDRGFEAQLAHSAAMKRSLASVAETVRAINVAVADLTKSNQTLSQRIDAAISRLNTLIKETRKRKVAQRKPVAGPKPRPAKTPPFHVDAIDVWDDETYVAISQAGRVAFLKSGERQSGWTVARIDRLKGRVEFKGPVGQHHSVSLQR